MRERLTGSWRLAAAALYLAAIVMFGIALTQAGSRRFGWWMLGGATALILGSGLSIWRARRTDGLGGRGNPA